MIDLFLTVLVTVLLVAAIVALFVYARWLIGPPK
jgi:hypothetical protein